MPSFPKKERICGKTSIDAVLSKGRWGSCAPLKYCVYDRGDDESARILVSVPKKCFKRAVKRNLLKRRIREAYRLQKDGFSISGLDIMFVYTSSETASFSELKECVGTILPGLKQLI